MEFYGATDKGIVRKENQDVFLCEDVRITGGILLAVCDGMGGAKAGHIASTMGLNVFRDSFFKDLDPFYDEKAIAQSLVNAIQQANTEIYRRSCTDPECSGMGTTLVAAYVSRKDAVVANIGDSRRIVISRTGISQLSRDHSVVEDMIGRGEITRDEAKTHPNRNLITRALGTGPQAQTDIFFPTIGDGEWLLLCSDGLSNIISDTDIMHIVTGAESVKSACENLVQQTVVRGAPDNVTVAVLKK